MFNINKSQLCCKTLVLLSCFLVFFLSSCSTTRLIRRVGADSEPTVGNITNPEPPQTEIHNTVLDVATDTFINPLKTAKFYVTSLFGPRIDPIKGIPSNHNGMDMAIATGSPVYAVMSGTVEVAGWHKSYGNYVIIRHENDYKSLYAHMSQILTTKGAKVVQGEKIGLVGSTGYSTGPHLHLTMYKSGNLVDPITLAVNQEPLDIIVYPEKKIGKLYFIPESYFSVRNYPVKSVKLDLYYIIADKKVFKEPTINYVVTFDSSVKNVDSFSLALESNGVRYELKNTSILYKIERTKTEPKGLEVSFVSAMSEDQMRKFLDKEADGPLYIVLKYGNEEEIKISSNNFYNRVSVARGLPSKTEHDIDSEENIHNYEMIDEIIKLLEEQSKLMELEALEEAKKKQATEVQEVGELFVIETVVVPEE